LKISFLILVIVVEGKSEVLLIREVETVVKNELAIVELVTMLFCGVVA
jgi:hypothetical protein